MAPGPRALPFATLAAVTLLAGCVLPWTQLPVFVLEYDIVDLHHDGPRNADPGDHCGEIRRDGNTLRISLDPDQKRPGGPQLAVFPQLPQPWLPSMNDRPFTTTFPHIVQPHIADDPTTLGELDLPSGAEGELHLDGAAITLPHAWNVTAPDGTWRADLQLSQWSGDVRLKRNSHYCD